MVFLVSLFPLHIRLASRAIQELGRAFIFLGVYGLIRFVGLCVRNVYKGAWLCNIWNCDKVRFF